MKDYVVYLCKIFKLNAYMPCDCNRQGDNFAIFMEVISEVHQLIQTGFNPFVILWYLYSLSDISTQT